MQSKPGGTMSDPLVIAFPDAQKGGRVKIAIEGAVIAVK
jgi:hypothetical protein